MKKQFLFIFLVSLTLFANAQKGKIEGSIYDAQNNEPLPFTNVVVWGTNIGSTSDLDGNFIFTGLEPGYVKLAVSAIGYERKITEDILVTNAKTAYIEIALQKKAIEVKEVVIKANPFKLRKESPTSLSTLGVSEIEKNPGSNRDISRVIQSLPGVASSVAFRNDVIVRGGGPNENRFYLDGIEIPNINHFATQGASGGPVGIINVDFIKEVDFYSGAFPANRSNALSSVLVFKQRDGNKDKVNFRGAVGASDLALQANGPLTNNTTFIASARRSYLQFLFDVIGLPFLPTYNDFQFKTKTIFDEKNQLTVIGLGAIDQFSLNTGLENPDESQRYILGYLPVNEQWNYTIGLNYKRFKENSFENFVLSRNMLNNIAYKYKDNDESSDQNLLLDYSSQEMENKFRYENTRTINDFKINFGVDFQYARYLNSTFQKILFGDSLIELDYSTSLDMFKWGAFGQISKTYFENRLSLSLGLRMDANDYSKSMNNMFEQLSPRFSASFALTENISYNFNTGIYYQLPPYTALGYRNNIGALVNKYNGLKYIQSNHIVTGFSYLPNDKSKVSVEGFYKTYSDYPFSVRDSIALASKSADFGTFGDEELISIGEGRAYGFEVLARSKDIYGFNGILSYTYVRSEFKNFEGDYLPSSWDNRHILNITFTRSFKKNWDVGMKWRFVGGAPYTPWDLDRSANKLAWDAQGRGYLDYSQYNSLRFGSFHQLDVRVDKSFFFDKWSLVLYIDIQNFYNFQADQQEVLLNTDENGVPVIINPTAPESQQRYQLRTLRNSAGTVLPTIGVIVEF
jgi:hypothetical protein